MSNANVNPGYMVGRNRPRRGRTGRRLAERDRPKVEQRDGLRSKRCGGFVVKTPARGTGRIADRRFLLLLGSESAGFVALRSVSRFAEDRSSCRWTTPTLPEPGRCRPLSLSNSGAGQTQPSRTTSPVSADLNAASMTAMDRRTLARETAGVARLCNTSAMFS